ncbi:MAG: inositol monophosphatase family protein, partial [Planctomycetia bacterium]
MAGGYRAERETAEQAARQAGQILLDWMGKFSVRKKGVNDLVTEADNAAQESIQRLLQRAYPNDGFLGEETAAADFGRNDPAQQGRRRWIVDPLDGTTNYVHRIPFFCVSIGLEVEGRLVVGVIYDPLRKEMFSAAAGDGATLNGQRFQVSPEPNLNDGVISVGLPADPSTLPGAIDIFTDLSRQQMTLRRMGSAALSLAYTACGRFDGFWAESLKPWDAAGGVALV